MGIPTKEAMLLRIFVGEDERYQRQPLYEAIVRKARAARLAGTTVIRSPMGFGKSGRLRSAKLLRLPENLPIVIEIIDTEEKIRQFLPTLYAMISSGLVTLKKVQALQYGRRSAT
jgi:uncharacterized protein